jgi:hypothetical protein
MPDPIFGKPRIVTWDQMQAALLPHIRGYSWAMDTLGDLWRMCTPTPNQVLRPDSIGTEMRIILPNDFAAWWEDVRQKMGIEATAAEVIKPGRSWG